MRIVIDTNVVISGVFFGGKPRKILEAVLNKDITACANTSIIDEYEEITTEMILRKQGHIRRDILAPFIAKLEIYDPVADLHICRDPDDDKFLCCAVDAKAYYIVSGDKDLLDIGQLKNIEIITAADFYEKFLRDPAV